MTFETFDQSDEEIRPDQQKTKTTRLRKLCETQIEGIYSSEFDTDMLPGSYPHRKYMVCMV